MEKPHITLATMLSPITHRDLPLYREFFARDQRSACYGNSWTYITQACRGFGLGLKYHQPDMLFSIGQHRGHYVVVRPLGPLDTRFLTLLTALRKASGKPVFIKKLFPDQVDRLRQFGTFHEAARYEARTGQASAGTYPWDLVAFADDDTYPELIVDINVTRQYWLKPREWCLEFQKAIGNLAHPPSAVREHYRKFRRSVHQFLRRGIGCRLSPCQPSAADTVRQFLLRYFGEARLPHVEAYETMLTASCAALPEECGFCFVAQVDGIESPVGFFYGERLDAHSVGSYARVVARCHPGFPEYLGIRLMSQLWQAGISFLNVGGSETEGLHVFKQKHAPIEERYMQMLVSGVGE
jgi:hypothetical protein